MNIKKNFILKPVNQITATPDAKINKAVPKSGCVATNKTGMKSANIGVIKYFKFITCSDGILL